MTDDSEEVFRRAAEHYPLKTDNPDWELMLQKMRDNPPVDEVEPKRKTNRRFLWLLLLLLLPLTVIEWKYHFIFGENEKLAGTGPSKQETIQPGNYTHSTEYAATVPVNGNEQPGVEADQPAVSEYSKATSVVGEKAIAPALDGTRVKTLHQKKQLPENNAVATNQPQRIYAKNSARSSRKTSIPTDSPVSSNEEKVDSRTSTPDLAKRDGINIKEAAKTSITVEQGELINEQTNSTTREKEKEEPLALLPEISKDSSVKAAKTSSAEKVNDESKAGKKSGQKRFYAGLIAGPDVSSIKLQKVDKVGFSYGVIAGYRISNCFSIETGLLRDKKLYSSEGKYFSTKNLPLYPNTTISSVKGECKMWELPLNVNFSVCQREKSGWFVSAGASGYFMQNEFYVFNVSRYGMNYNYASDYKSHDRQLFAVVNLAAAYTRRLGKIADLRIQPYLKIPVNKVGTGELPIQSAGLMIGLTKDLF